MKELIQEILAFGGLVNRMPNYAMVFMVLTLANVGLHRNIRIYRRISLACWCFSDWNLYMQSLVLLEVILSACYGLLLYKRVILGELIKEKFKKNKRSFFKRKICLYPLVLLIIIFGIYPKPIIETYSVTVANYLQILN